ncbi:hypothetical protein [Streptomyces boncukensis]|uniref:Neocarzinostatin family protein n=1 Tax=Streptomyces boncukensis TaxID=2711219 RepID=A0A6G4WXU4_9ACTN|nr:hypothetical protein [Streptomyces boncukensis]NGO69928.1 hypothetical protein [Streptomyces boncukensis]
MGIRTAAALLAALLVLATPAPAARAAPGAEDGAPRVTLSRQEAGAGATVTVRGTGWRPKTLLTLLVCGRNGIGGTDSCAAARGRAVTTDRRGAFRERIPVAEPPQLCPCVVRAETVTGARASADAPLKVAGHPVRELPRDTPRGELAVLDARLDGGGGLLAWFGAPQRRTLVLTVRNSGSRQAKNPVFEVGAAHGVFAPDWERRRWRGTVAPGKRARVELPVELASGAHGDYTVAAKYGTQVLAEEPWSVGRPWGVTLFWALLCVVVPMALFRLGMVLVNRLRPREPAGRKRNRHRRVHA